MIYLDHAATSWPKPAVVVSACQRWLPEGRVSADRGDGPQTREAREVVQRVRRGIAAMTGHDPDHVALCSGATEGLNLVLRALLSNRRRVTTTSLEHSSVVRPLLALQAQGEVSVYVVGQDHGDELSTDSVCDALRTEPADVLIFTHASNVTGGVFDAQQICDVARSKGIATVLDVSQTVGYLPINVGADIVVGSCHKAMHGPPGLGFVSTNSEVDLPPQKFGGTGSSVALAHHPTSWPQAFEAGTPNTLAIFGAAAALDWLEEQGTAKLLQRSLAALRTIEAGVDEITSLRSLSPGTSVRTPVLSFVHEDYDPLEVSTILSANGIHTRAGFHCAPWAHQRLGTGAAGTVRISTGPHTTAADTEALLDALRSL